MTNNQIKRMLLPSIPNGVKRKFPLRSIKVGVEQSSTLTSLQGLTGEYAQWESITPVTIFFIEATQGPYKPVFTQPELVLAGDWQYA